MRTGLVGLLQKFRKPVRGCWVLVALAACLSGCVSPLSSTDSNAHITLRLSTWGSAEEIQVTRALINQFEARHPGIHVEILHIPDNYYQKLHILVAGGLTPDVVFTNSLTFPVYAANGVFQDLTPYLRHSRELKASHFFSASLKAFAWKQSLQALPRDISNLVVYYNRDLFRRAGLCEPAANWTWKQFIADAQKLTLRSETGATPSQYGVSFYRTPPLFWLPFVWSAGGSLFNPSMTRLQLEQPSAVRGLQFYSDWINRYHIAPSREQSGGATMSQLFLQQKIAMVVSGRWSVPVFRKQAGFAWDVVPLPQGPSGSHVGIDASGYAMSAETEHPKAAWALIEFLLSRPAIQQVARSGLIVPARPDVAETAVFLSPKEQPLHSRAFLEVISRGIPTQTPPRWNEVSEMLGLALEPVWDGQETPQEALKKATPDINALLSREAADGRR